MALRHRPVRGLEGCRQRVARAGSGGGKPARELHAGDVVNIPANVKHWHGAAADSWFQHIGLEIEGEDAWNEWLEPVSDEECARLG